MPNAAVGFVRSVYWDLKSLHTNVKTNVANSPHYLDVTATLTVVTDSCLRHTYCINTVSTVHLVVACPAASICRQPRDLHSSACGRRWRAAWRSFPRSSHLVGPEISRTSGLSVCACAPHAYPQNKDICIISKSQQ